MAEALVQGEEFGCSTLHITCERPSGSTLPVHYKTAELDPSLAAQQKQAQNITEIRELCVCVCVCACARAHFNRHDYNKIAQVPTRALMCGGQPECQPCRGQHESSWAGTLPRRENFKTEKLLVNILWVLGSPCSPSS